MDTKKMPLRELVQTENWKRFINRLEIGTTILLGIIILMMAVNYTDNSNFRILLSASLSSLAIYCYFIGFHNFVSNSKILSYLFYKIHGYGLSLGFITVLFVQYQWPCPKEIMYVVTPTLILISLILGIIEITDSNKNKINWKYFLRILIALISIGYLIINKEIVHFHT